MNTELTQQERVTNALALFRREASDTLSLCDQLEPIMLRLPSDVLENCSVCTGQLLIYRASRDKAERIMRALSAGRWDKSLNTTEDSPRVNYTATIDGITVEIWGTQPPASCQIIERPEYVPAHNRIVRELVCK